ncbi:hypothetical protein PYCCODRAFT_1431018 [Trametes coccinea BRFM310]|uniref:Uncharacterized protein n=1 Tax=Trametes coccinea (strain BRFM310) TaxID=1353009 RepID=A0A1Y2J0A3_TRAC3|nr:hypothetical protein PYCCODRAFT_1431018 [Trametes coccinea BRFM310]
MSADTLTWTSTRCALSVISTEFVFYLCCWVAISAHGGDIACGVRKLRDVWLRLLRRQ